jgi:hypothetical protein
MCSLAPRQWSSFWAALHPTREGAAHPAVSLERMLYVRAGRLFDMVGSSTRFCRFAFATAGNGGLRLHALCGSA